MHCPSCRALDTKVIDSRVAEDGSAIRRRRQCPQCGHRFTTYERLEEIPLMVVKSHGGRQPFDRVKVIDGVRAAAKGRPVTAEQIEALADSVEEVARLECPDVSSTRVGMLVLERLRAIDEVTYLRFASVYKNFDAAADFHREIELLTKSASA